MSRIPFYIRRLWERMSYAPISTAGSRAPRRLRYLRNYSPTTLLCLPNIFIVAWIVLLLWGERWGFRSSVSDCDWASWEQWPENASPHHLIFVADPQLIDPHSYPGRPWPLDRITMLHTDNYIKRSYIAMQRQLRPDTVFFLGDLFDGGREWKTSRGSFQDPAWRSRLRPAGEQAYAKLWNKKYGEDFWLREYDRFGRIFYKFWNFGGSDPRPWQRGRKIISSLPGNHDLGFGENIKIPVRNRFELYFGEGNRVDVIANHTFVSVDSVSLSASESSHDTADIVRPVDEFLSSVQVSKRKAVARELGYLAGKETLLRYAHKVEDLETANFTDLPTLDPGPGSADFPTILLTHVPLYREPGTPCGPQREHWPPAKGQQSSTTYDERNAISISKGYQYQNVLSPSDSIKLISNVGNVVSVFSGDDHDYCEVVHSAFKNSVKEITVKSISWAMGVRRPGFLLLSMWNPVDASGQPLQASHTDKESSSTMKSHLCLLPDQIGIFIRYLFLLILTLASLVARAILTPTLNLTPFSSQGRRFDLPTARKNSWRGKDVLSRSSTSSTSSNPVASRFSVTKPSRLTKTPSKNSVEYFSGKDGIKLSMERHLDEEKPMTAYTYAASMKSRVRESTRSIIFREAWTSVWRVTWVVLPMYLYLFYSF